MTYKELKNMKLTKRACGLPLVLYKRRNTITADNIKKQTEIALVENSTLSLLINGIRSQLNKGGLL